MWKRTPVLQVLTTLVPPLTSTLVYGAEGDASWYLQGGPTVVSPDGGEAETILTAKVGGGVGVTEALSVYGEISAAFDDTNSYGTKAGLKYRF